MYASVRTCFMCALCVALSLFFFGVSRRRYKGLVCVCICGSVCVHMWKCVCAYGED